MQKHNTVSRLVQMFA